MKANKSLAVLLALALLFAAAVPCAAAKAAPTYRNVIFMIGDGMGENHLLLAREQGVDLFMDAACDLRGQSKTRSLSDSVTDSAAGGSALACGVRISNGAVAVYPIDPKGVLLRPRSFTEAAIAHGMKTGVITTDKTTGATPASFSAHTKSRDDAAEITAQQIASDIDLIWGAAAEQAAREEVEAVGRTYVSNLSGMQALTPGSRSFGQFTGDIQHASPAAADTPTLAEMSVKAIELLSADAENGFFLMIEGAHIDKYSHATQNDAADFPEKYGNVADAMRSFDDAVRAAVEFARADGHTVVLVTADHETGDIYAENGRMTFHSGSHTGKNVPVLVYCANDLFRPGEAVENRSIPGRLTKLLGWSGTDLPRTDPGSFWKKLKAMLTNKEILRAAA